MTKTGKTKIRSVNICLGSPELLQKPHIILEHMPDVVDVEHQCGHSFEAEAECEPGIDARVDIACTKDVRMNHPRTAKFYPAGPFARTTALAFELTGSVALETRKIELGRRLGEREVRRTKPRDSVLSVHSFEPFGHGALQMSHRDAFIDAKTLELMKHRRMRHIGRVAAKDLARRKNTDWRAAPFHRTYLYGRGLRTQRKARRCIKRIL